MCDMSVNINSKHTPDTQQPKYPYDMEGCTFYDFQLLPFTSKEEFL